jgi:hypothetical protein
MAVRSLLVSIGILALALHAVAACTTGTTPDCSDAGEMCGPLLGDAAPVDATGTADAAADAPGDAPAQDEADAPDAPADIDAPADAPVDSPADARAG